MEFLTERAYSPCRLCPRACGVDRLHGQRGYCGMGATAVLAYTMRHMWEEPFLSGQNGSGTVFFSGCSLGCTYCQNRAISTGERGKAITVEALADAFLSLEKQGAHNINLVTAAHFLPSVCHALYIAKDKGLSLPVVYNTSGYEDVDSLKMLEGLVDIYLTDMRYAKSQTAEKYSSAPDYPQVAKKALSEMVKQTGTPRFSTGGMMQKGTVVRFLLLPSHLIEAKMCVKQVFTAHGDQVYYSLMRQYTPMKSAPPPLDRAVSDGEYISFVRYAQELGITQALTQEKGAVGESFIPPFEK